MNADSRTHPRRECGSRVGTDTEWSEYRWPEADADG